MLKDTWKQIAMILAAVVFGWLGNAFATNTALSERVTRVEDAVIAIKDSIVYEMKLLRLEIEKHHGWEIEPLEGPPEEERNDSR